MKYTAMHVVAGLVGMAAGWAVTADSVAARFVRAAVTWDASGCPSGVYTITSTAESLENGARYQVTSGKMSLPRLTVVQEFQDLPPGTYSVTASAKRRDGRTFGSNVQLLNTADATVGVGRRRPPAAPSTGVAGPRRPPTKSISSTTGSTARLGAAPAPVPTGPAPVAARRTIQPRRPLGSLQLDDLGDLMGADVGWRRIEMVDIDGDGQADLVRIELVDGSLLDWRIWR